MTDTSALDAMATISRNDLAGALTFASLGLSRRPVLPVLGGMLVTIGAAGLELAAFDYETAARVTVPCDTAGDARILANGGELTAAVKSLPKGKTVRAELTVEGGRLVIDCDGIKASVSSLPLDEYPQLPALPEVSGVADGAAFNRSVTRVAAAAGTDDTLPVLLCVKMASDGGALELAATDRYRLAVDSLPWTGPDGVSLNVPAVTLVKFAKAADKHGKITMHVGEGHAAFSDGARTLITHTTQGEYPKFKSLIPTTSDTLVTVDAAALEAAVTRAGKMAERGIPPHFDMTGSGITVTVRSGEGEVTSQQTIPATIDGPAFDARFDAGYLSSLLKGFIPGDVRIGFKVHAYEVKDKDGNVTESGVTTSKPARLTAEDDTLTAVIMPIRRQQ